MGKCCSAHAIPFFRSRDGNRPVSVRPCCSVVQLTWSPRLAQQAQDWAQRCVWRHSTFQERFGTGENMYYSAGFPVQSIGERSSRAWYREVADYDYSNPGQPKQQGRMIGHFTASKQIWET